MKITDLRIGDRVQNKTSKFPMVVVALFRDGTVHLDFDGNDGDVWEENIEDLEFCEPRYKLPEWKKYLDTDTILSIVYAGHLQIEYPIDEYENGGFHLFFNRNVGDTTICRRIGEYSTLEGAKVAAERHYNMLVDEMVQKLTKQ